MKNLILVFGIAFGISVAVAASNPPVEIKDASGKVVGHATLKEGPKGVEISVVTDGLDAGPKGMHIHAVGLCESPDFKSAGGHFNPDQKMHGRLNPQGHHMGDLGNFDIPTNKKGKRSVKVDGVFIKADSLLQPDGTSIVIHAKPDDEKTDPSGNSGDRIACGVISPKASSKK